MTLRLPKITIWRVIFAAILLSGAYATYLRIFYGLGGSTNLSDRFPWGIWIAFDILCGVGLAAGGFTLVAVVHIFNIERYKPILRPAILTAFLGYSLVVVALLFDVTTLDTTGDQVVVRVKDSGSGIPEDMLPHIFEPFFTTKQDQLRTGLGLAVAHSIVEQHGGEISVRSTPGEGTEFTVALPASAAEYPLGPPLETVTSGKS